MDPAVFGYTGSPRLRERVGWPPSAASSTTTGSGTTGHTLSDLPHAFRKAMLECVCKLCSRANSTRYDHL